MDVKNALELANAEFVSRNIKNYFYETREIMARVLGKSKEWLMCNTDFEIPEESYKEFCVLKNKRIKGTPLQYILGEQYFMGIRFIVNENVLIPRADTEILVYKVIELFEKMKSVEILDMCTGSGCIAVSLSKKMLNSKIYASDISKEALEIAKNNSDINEADVEFFHSDLFENIPNKKFDAIVSNPPYISASEMEELSEEVLKEPHIALNGGIDGLKFYKEISKESKRYLKDGGSLIFEIGCSQAKSVCKLLHDMGYKDIEVEKDYSGNDRVIIAKI